MDAAPVRRWWSEQKALATLPEHPARCVLGGERREQRLGLAKLSSQVGLPGGFIALHEGTPSVGEGLRPEQLVDVHGLALALHRDAIDVPKLDRSLSPTDSSGMSWLLRTAFLMSTSAAES